MNDAGIDRPFGLRNAADIAAFEPVARYPRKTPLHMPNAGGFSESHRGRLRPAS